MTTYTLRPAPLAQTRIYRVDDTGLVCLDVKENELWFLPWTQIEHIAFVDHPAKSQRMRRLDLVAGPVVTRSLSFTGPADADPAADTDTVTFLDLCADVLDRVEALRPGMPVSWGEHGRSRAILFGIGVASALGALAIGGLALATGVSSDRLAAAAVPVGVMLVLGGVLINANAPWKKPPTMPAVSMARAMRLTARPEPAAEQET